MKIVQKKGSQFDFYPVYGDDGGCGEIYLSSQGNLYLTTDEDKFVDIKTGETFSNLGAAWCVKIEKIVWSASN